MKINTRRILSLLMAVVPLTVGAAGNNWMSGISDSLMLSQFSIPGTHESGAQYEPFPAQRYARIRPLPIS